MTALYAYARNYVKDEKSAAVFRNAVQEVILAKKRSGFHFGMYMNYARELPLYLVKEIVSLDKELIKEKIELKESVAAGAGAAFIDIFEESTSIASQEKKRFVLFILDGDGQYPLSDKAFLHDMKKLAEDVVRKNAIIGVGMRTKILLGKGKFGLYREIEETICNLFLGKKFEIAETKRKVQKHYRDAGDAFTGVYCINPFHAEYIELLKDIFEDDRKADLTGHAGDFYTLMKASRLGTITSRVVKTNINPLESVFSSAESIHYKTQQLLKTSLGEEYGRFLRSKKLKEKLASYFPEDDAAHVLGVMLGKQKNL